MNLPSELPASVPQRWERPLDFEPGHWKKQLPTKYLQVAARGDFDGLRQLLAEHPEFLNKRGSHGRTLLWEATRWGKLEAVKWLVEQGAEVDATGCYNGESYVQLTPYCAAIYYRREDVAAYLSTRDPQLDIFRAAFTGDQKRVAEALAADPAMVNAEDPFDDIYFVPLLAFAVVGGHLAMVEILLKRGAIVTPYSAQLIHLAARASRLDLIEMLVAYGADMRAVDTGIFVAVLDLQIMRYLLTHGASATAVGKNGFPPLIYLSRGDKSEHPDKLQLLLEHGASVNAIGPKGRTALHYAAAGGHLQSMTVLLHYGADPTLRDHQGQTPLSLARATGKIKAANLLMQRGAR
jgi:ankyrin repeat protein